MFDAAIEAAYAMFDVIETAFTPSGETSGEMPDGFNSPGWIYYFYINKVVFLGWLALFVSPSNHFLRPSVVFPACVLGLLFGSITYYTQIIEDFGGYEEFKTLDGVARLFGTRMGAVGAKIHIMASDLLVGHLWCLDYTSNFKQTYWTGLWIRVQLLVTLLSGPVCVWSYLLIRWTILSKYKILQKHDYFHLKSRFQVLQEKYRDEVPELHPFLRTLPFCVRLPIYTATFILGTLLLLPVLICMLLWTQICVLLWTMSLHHPFERIEGKSWPPKAVVAITGHLRLNWLHAQHSPFVKFPRALFPYMILLDIGIVANRYYTSRFGESLVADFELGELGGIVYAFFIAEHVIGIFPWFLELECILEFLPFKDDQTKYIDALVAIFGDVVPFGNGLCFTRYEKVKSLIEDPQCKKHAQIYGWSTSSALKLFSDKATLFYPRTELERSIVFQGRKVTRAWLKDAITDLEKQSTKERLKQILPYPPADGSMLKTADIETAIGTTLFHLLTGGALKKDEDDTYRSLVNNPLPFFPDWLSFLAFGGLLRKGTNSYIKMRDAILRYPQATPLQAALEQAKLYDWEEAETIRFLTIVFGVAGAGGPCTLAKTVIERLYENPCTNLELYEENKLKFILEAARLKMGLPVVPLLSTSPNMTVDIDGRTILVPLGTPLLCSIASANRDSSIFGENGDQFDPKRDPSQLYKLLTWNGTESLMMDKKNPDTPHRGCPGHDISLQIVKFVVDLYKPDLNIKIDELVTPHRYREIWNSELTSTVKGLVAIAKAKQKKHNGNPPHACDALHPGDASHEQLRFVKLPWGDSLPLFDEDEPASKLSSILSEVVKVPIYDPSGDWESADEALGFRLKYFGNLFPQCNIVVENWETNEHLSQFAFAGAGCFRTYKVDQNRSLPAIPPNAAYVSECLALSKYAVRDGFQRYGAAAYFDSNFEIIGIYTCYNGSMICPPILEEERCLARRLNIRWPHVAPGARSAPRETHHNSAQEWKHAICVWKNSILALVTVVDHLGKAHLIEANALAAVTRTHLSPRHPFRAMAKIFTYRTVNMNVNAFKVLFGDKGFIERIWAFEGDALKEIMEGIKDNYEFCLLPDNIPESMRNVDPKVYPANDDARQYWEIMHTFVLNYMMAIYQDNPKNLDDDVEMQNCLEDLAGRLKLNKDENLSEFDDVVNVFASLFCTVTAYHEHVGQISDYFFKPDFVGTTLREGKDMDSIQTYLLLCALTCATGMRCPALLGNWEHLLQLDIFAHRTVPILRVFQAELIKLEDSITEKNQQRRFPLQSFNPKVLESSVSL